MCKAVTCAYWLFICQLMFSLCILSAKLYLIETVKFSICTGVHTCLFYGCLYVFLPMVCSSYIYEKQHQCHCNVTAVSEGLCLIWLMAHLQWQANNARRYLHDHHCLYILASYRPFINTNSFSLRILTFLIWDTWLCLEMALYLNVSPCVT